MPEPRVAVGTGLRRSHGRLLGEDDPGGAEEQKTEDGALGHPENRLRLKRPNVAAEIASVEFDLIDCIVGSPLAANNVSPTAVTPRTRPPEVRVRFSFICVPAWKTMTSSILVDMLQSGNRFSDVILAGIAAGSHDDANGGTDVPLYGDRIKPFRDRSFEKIDEIGFESGHENLGLRIPKPAIKFQHAWAILRKHQPGKEQPAKLEMIFLDAAHKRFQDRFANFPQKRFVQPLRRAEGSHTSSIRPEIPVIELFMILCSGEEDVGAPIHAAHGPSTRGRKEILRSLPSVLHRRSDGARSYRRSLLRLRSGPAR